MLFLQSYHKVIERITFTSNDNRLLTSGESHHVNSRGNPDCGIDIWNLAGGSVVESRALSDYCIRWFAELSDGRLVVVGYAKAEDGSWGRLSLAIFEQSVAQIRWAAHEIGRYFIYPWSVHPKSPKVVIGSVAVDFIPYYCDQQFDGRTIACWDLQQNQNPQLDWQVLLGRDRHLRALAFSPDDLFLWSAEWGTEPFSTELIPRHSKTGEAVGKSIIFPTQNVSSMSFSP